MTPTSFPRRDHEFDRGLTGSILKQAFQQILSRIDRAPHAAFDQPIHDFLAMLLFHEAEG